MIMINIIIHWAFENEHEREREGKEEKLYPLIMRLYRVVTCENRKINKTKAHRGARKYKKNEREHYSKDIL